MFLRVRAAADLHRGPALPPPRGGPRRSRTTRWSAFARKRFAFTDQYDERQAVHQACGARAWPRRCSWCCSPIGSTDLLFALDSIPAVFGVTEEAFIVFAANAFALLGLRALFFLVSGLLDRLVYLSTGLALILAFIGVEADPALRPHRHRQVDPRDLDRLLARRDRDRADGHHGRQPAQGAAGPGGEGPRGLAARPPRVLRTTAVWEGDSLRGEEQDEAAVEP